ncbi:hypothetical protein [Sphingomonas sp. KR3-1]|uniref:hypothetical protein n=1 Tax=Sphingomonas sp. KR3-1 TaxID=3156611 RepID=UPI0032B5F940
MAVKRTCFVISPIGADGSEIRARANDFLELLAEPALQMFSFDVIRADKIQQATAITGDIIRLVQESDLCLIDLTDSNPNVFYECGRRHETGKPFIQLVAKGHEGALPFDVAGIRTIIYDLDSPREALRSVKELQGFIQLIIDAGFTIGNPGESLAAMSQSIERIERKVNLLVEGGGGRQANAAGGGRSLEDYMLPPSAVFMKAIREGNLDRAFSAAQRLKGKDTPEYASLLLVLASAGQERAYLLLSDLVSEEIAKGAFDEVSTKTLMMSIGGVKKYFEELGTEDKAVTYLNDLVVKIMDMDGSGGVISFIYNQLGIIYAGKDESKSIEYTLLAIKYNKEEPAYIYNLCLSYERVGDVNNLNKWLKKLGEMDVGDDEDHAALLRKYGFGT